MNYVIEPAEQAYLPIHGSDTRFPVRRVYCVGRNYAAHAIEMGGNPEREEPFFFQKNSQNLLIRGAAFPYPSRSDDVHHEIELLVALGGGGSDMSLADARGSIYGYAVALDMTRRDLQGECKQAGRPWEIGKAFEHSAPCGELHPASSIGHPDAGKVELLVNGELRQSGDLGQMIWKVPEIIACLSGLFELAAGDVILTGTPAGVGPVQPGDELLASIEGVGQLLTRVE